MATLAENPFAILTLIVAPAVLTNACSLLALNTANRFGRAIDRSRWLTAEMDRLENTSEEYNVRQRQLEQRPSTPAGPRGAAGPLAAPGADGALHGAGTVRGLGVDLGPGGSPLHLPRSLASLHGGLQPGGGNRGGGEPHLWLHHPNPRNAPGGSQHRGRRGAVERPAVRHRARGGLPPKTLRPGEGVG
jgi:hypothetical protein